MGTTGTPIGLITIQKADIEAFLNTCLEDDVTAADLTEAIKLCLRDLSNMGLLNGSDTTQDLDDGDLTLDVPAEYKDVRGIQLSDADGTLHDSLIPFSRGHEEYRQSMAESVSTGTPEQYSEYDGHFYLYPPPDGHYHVNIEYQKYDTQDPDVIEFGDEFSNALKYGTLYFYAMMKGRERYINIWGPQYQNEKEFRRINMKHQPFITR